MAELPKTHSVGGEGAQPGEGRKHKPQGNSCEMRTGEILEPLPLPRSMCFVIHFAELSEILSPSPIEKLCLLGLLEGLSINHMMYCCDNCTQLEVKQNTSLKRVNKVERI